MWLKGFNSFKRSFFADGWQQNCCGHPERGQRVPLKSDSSNRGHAGGYSAAYLTTTMTSVIKMCRSVSVCMCWEKAAQKPASNLFRLTLQVTSIQAGRESTRERKRETLLYPGSLAPTVKPISRSAVNSPPETHNKTCRTSASSDWVLVSSKDLLIPPNPTPRGEKENHEFKGNELRMRETEERFWSLKPIFQIRIMIVKIALMPGEVGNTKHYFRQQQSFIYWIYD